MKIRAFTDIESADLVNLINQRDKLTIEINELGITILLREYEKYSSNFKYNWRSPLTFKAMNKDKFITAMLGGGGVYTQQVGRVVEVNNGEVVKYLYGWQSDRRWEYDTDVLNKTLWICDAISTFVIRDSKGDDQFINKLIQYAARPFEFNESDIERIMRWKNEVRVLVDTVELLKNELHAK